MNKVFCQAAGHHNQIVLECVFKPTKVVRNMARFSTDANFSDVLQHFRVLQHGSVQPLFDCLIATAKFQTQSHEGVEKMQRTIFL